jgi:hypothetical protein
MKRFQLALAGLFFGAFGVGFVGCGSVDQAFDCQSVCSKYQTCFKADYDVGACRDRCRNKVSQEKADACESCISGKSCAPATFSCAIECADIVP